MIYFRAHVRALEEQIAYFKEQLLKTELEKRAVEEAARRRIVDLEATARAREDALLDRLAKAEEGARRRENGLLDRLAKAEEGALARADVLLDRVLVKNNITPVTEQPKPPRAEILTPFGVAEADIQDAFRESFLREETEHIMNRDNCDEGTARAYAEQEYVARYRVIK